MNLVVLLFFTQFLRNVTFNMQQSIGIHTGAKIKPKTLEITTPILTSRIPIHFSLKTSIFLSLLAIRLLSAVEYCGYSKLLRLTSPNEAALGQLITFTTADHERIQDSVVNGCLFIGTPFMFLLSIVYSIYLVGPSALVGSVVILLFYPIMGVIASATAKLRLKVVTITDKRVTMMGEIINSMRLIKMYAWEIPFMKVPIFISIPKINLWCRGLRHFASKRSRSFESLLCCNQ